MNQLMGVYRFNFTAADVFLYKTIDILDLFIFILICLYLESEEVTHHHREQYIKGSKAYV